MRLIDADALLDFLDVGHLRPPTEICFSELMMKNIIDIQPTIDAVPARHVRWLYSCVYGKVEFVCNQCGEEANTKTKYCPNCGARMDAERKEHGNDV